MAGDPASGQALVTGDPVNVAARLEQHAGPGRDPAGRRRRTGSCATRVDADAVAPLEVKGKGERVPAWRLLGVRDVDPSAPRHLDSPMVGRERQLAQLGQSFAAAVEDSSCQLFTVLGSAGVGKSRLVEEFLSSLERPRARCCGDDASPTARGSRTSRSSRRSSRRPDCRTSTFPMSSRRRCARSSKGEEHQDQVCRHVAQVMGVADARGGDETFWAIRRFFEATARDRPLVLVFDDIHWGEPTFLDLVEHIADWSRESSILLLCMARARPARRPSYVGRREAERGDRVTRATHRG